MEDLPNELYISNETAGGCEHKEEHSKSELQRYTEDIDEYSIDTCIYHKVVHDDIPCITTALVISCLPRTRKTMETLEIRTINI